MNVSVGARLDLDPALEPERYRAVFRRFGRLHVPAFLTPATAKALWSTLECAEGWVRALHTAGGHCEILAEEVEELPPDERAQFEASVQTDARDAFRYMFDTIRISDEERGPRKVAPLLNRWLDFVNGPEFLGFMRALTGDERIVYCDAMATRYLPGHFATAHQDEVEKQHRLYAYVLNLTPRWRADWGGLLMFLDEDDHVAEGYTPAFNAINVFRVPQRHAVSFVTPAAAGPRLSITGWARARLPQGG
ncbi:MAG TPA: 2OG-Fe(II) oxygenase family protein [Caulobacteraceae bacterium]